MEIGFSSYAVGWWMSRQAPLETKARELLEFASELGYRRLQVACNCPLHELTDAERKAFRCAADLLKVRIEVGARRLTRGLLEQYVDLAGEFGSEFLRFVIDGNGYEPGVHEVVSVVSDRLDFLAERGVVLAIENHDRFSAKTLASMLQLWDSPWVGICLDTANSIGCGDDNETLFRELGPYVVNLHLKDVKARRLSHLQGFSIEGVPLGEGMVPVEKLLTRFNEQSRCVSATLEHWVPPLDDLDATIRRELEWCRFSTTRLFEYKSNCN